MYFLNQKTIFQLYHYKIKKKIMSEIYIQFNALIKKLS